MNYLVFDIETQNIFQEVGSNNPADLDLSVISIYDSKTDKVQSFTIDDLTGLWPIIEKTDVLVGYNSEHFDIPLLNKYYPGDLTQIKSIDLMVFIKKSLGRRPKLDDVAAATLKTKKSAHGLQATKWWKEGKVDQVIKYCEDDVKITRDLFLFALENKYVNLKDFSGKNMKIEIDTSTWEESSDCTLTHSLPF